MLCVRRHPSTCEHLLKVTCEVETRTEPECVHSAPELAPTDDVPLPDARIRRSPTLLDEVAGAKWHADIQIRVDGRHAEGLREHAFSATAAATRAPPEAASGGPR